jgi:hypothetical protein
MLLTIIEDTMKKLILGMFASCLILAASVNQAKAQISVNVNLWTPPAEYSDVEYYYLPDVESYYYAPKHQYVYLENNNWVFRNSLPSRYNGYNINNGYKVAVNRPQAYKYFTTDRTRYAKFKGSKNQVVVRGNSYNAHNKVVNKKVYKSNGNGNGNGKGHGNGGGHGKH